MFFSLLQDDGCGRVSVHNNKQGFLDCEVYAELERWLGERVDSYIDDYVDKVELVRYYFLSPVYKFTFTHLWYLSLI